jgi:NAD(P)H-hydrate epimerase
MDLGRWAATPSEMRIIENEVVEQGNISLEGLMEQAGRSVAEAILKERAKSVCIFCGKGNNGGDGLVCARYLAQAGREVTVFLASQGKSPLAQKNAQRLEKQNVLVQTDLGLARQAAERSDVLVDALFGFGFRGEAEGVYRTTIELVNEVKKNLGKRVFSIDVPSGIDATSGQVSTSCVKADYTVTFTCPKVGQLLFPAANFNGKILLTDIGMPQELVERHASVELSNSLRMKELLPERKPTAHKWSVGSVLIVAASAGLTGAASLAALGALRMGAGVVKLAVPESLLNVFEIKVSETLTMPLPEVEGAISSKAVPLIAKEAERFDVVLLGPGLSCHLEAQKLVRELVLKLDKPLVVDADGLNALTGQIGVLSQRKAPTVLTPHTGELSRLMGVGAAEIERDRINWAKRAAQASTGVVVLKGARTVIASANRTSLNLTGNAGLAKAGTGDVLAGLISALLAQGLSSHDAAFLGVYLHGLSADLAIKDLSEFSLVASDLMDYLPKAINLTKKEVRGTWKR